MEWGERIGYCEFLKSKLCFLKYFWSNLVGNYFLFLRCFFWGVYFFVWLFYFGVGIFILVMS